MAFIVWFCVNKQALQKPPILEPTNTAVELPPQQPKTNFIEVASNAALVQQPTNVIESMAPLSNALTATNIEQWKAAIKGLHKSPGLTERWNMEQTNRTTGIPIVLAENDKSVSYKVRFIDVEPLADGTIRKVEMHSPIMNIDETRELGLQLCAMLGRDPADFSAWCDKVGNNWKENPTLFSSGGSRTPNSDKFAGFGILNSFDNDKPWYIDFFITSP